MLYCDSAVSRLEISASDVRRYVIYIGEPEKKKCFVVLKGLLFVSLLVRWVLRRRVATEELKPRVFVGAQLRRWLFSPKCDNWQSSV